MDTLVQEVDLGHMEPTTEPSLQLLRVDEVAQMLRLSRSKVYELIASGNLSSVHIGRSVRITSEAVATFIHRLANESPQ